MQSLHLETVTAGTDCAVLRIAGEVDLYSAPQVRERVIQLLADGTRHIIADLREVDFLGLIRVFALHQSVPEAITGDRHWEAALTSEGHGDEEWCREHELL